MRICIFTHTFPRFDGDVAAPFMDGVARGIKSAGNEVWVLTPFSKLFKNSKKDYKVVTYKYVFPDFLHKLGYSETLSDDKKLKILSLFLSPLMLLFGTIALYRLVKKERIDLVNAHWILPNGFMASIVSKLLKVPVVSTLPGSDVYMADRNFLFRTMARFAAGTSVAITSNSPQLLDDLAKICVKDVKQRENLRLKFSTIIYGVDPSKFKPTNMKEKEILNKLNIPAGNKVVVGVGRLVAKKGFKYLVQSAPFILSQNKNVTFVVIGEGQQRKYLEFLVRKLGVENNFRFPGWVNYKDLVYYYNLGDIFILPSVRDEEGNLDDQSVSVVEAMACAKPVVTTDFPGYKLVVRDSINGFLVPEKDSSRIAFSITKILSSGLILRRMGKRSRELVTKNYSWSRVGCQYSKLFKSLVI